MGLVIDYRNNTTQLLRDLASMAQSERVRRIWLRQLERKRVARG